MVVQRVNPHFLALLLMRCGLILLVSVDDLIQRHRTSWREMTVTAKPGGRGAFLGYSSRRLILSP